MCKLETSTDRQTDIHRCQSTRNSFCGIFCCKQCLLDHFCHDETHKHTHTQKVKTLPADAGVFGKYVTLDLRLPWCELIQPSKTAYINHHAQNFTVCMLTVFTVSCYWVNQLETQVPGRAYLYAAVTLTSSARQGCW